MGALSSPTRSHDVACPCRTVGVLPCAACPAPRSCREHGTRAGAPEAGVAAIPRRSRPRLGWPVAAFPRPSALPPSGRWRPCQASGARRTMPAGAYHLCMDAGGSQGRAAGAPRASAGGVVARGLVRRSAVCVSHMRRGRGHRADRLTPEPARLPWAQGAGAAARASATLPGTSPACAEVRAARVPRGGPPEGASRASGAWAGRESGAQRGRTRACRRLEIAYAHSSLRLFPAPEAWR